MNQPLRVAIVGTCHPHSPLYQELLIHLDGIKIAGIYDDGGTVIEPLRPAPRFGSLDELLGRVQFEAALLAVPQDAGEQAACALAEAGKHVLADKPVCRNAREMARIVSAVRKAKITFAVGYQLRFHPAHRRARDLVRRGELGALCALRAHLLTTDVASRGPDHFLFRKERSGGGVLHWLGCHMIDIIRDLTGSELCDAAGVAGRVSDAAIDVEETAAFTFRLANGAVGSMVAGYTIPFDTHSPYADSPKDSGVAVWGREGQLSYEPFGNSLEAQWFRPGAGAPLAERFDQFALPAFPGYNGWLGRCLVEDFVESVREGRPPSANEIDNLRVLEVIDAVYGTAV